MQSFSQEVTGTVEHAQRFLSSVVTAVQVVIYNAERLVDLIVPTLDRIAAGTWRAGCEDLVHHGTKLSSLLARGPNGSMGRALFEYLAGEEVGAMQSFVVRAEAYLQRRARAEAARWPADEARAALDILRRRIAYFAAE